jgi:hypothetical protein
LAGLHIAGISLWSAPLSDIKKWLLAHPRFHLHFTPTSASWLTLVERWFAELTQKKLKRGVHRSVQALERDIRSWLADWNENPRPFVWTKTADEILDKVAAYWIAMSGSSDTASRQLLGRASRLHRKTKPMATVAPSEQAGELGDRRREGFK